MSAEQRWLDKERRERLGDVPWLATEPNCPPGLVRHFEVSAEEWWNRTMATADGHQDTDYEDMRRRNCLVLMQATDRKRAGEIFSLAMTEGRKRHDARIEREREALDARNAELQSALAAAMNAEPSVSTEFEDLSEATQMAIWKRSRNWKRSI
jgi:hypothetical protein